MRPLNLEKARYGAIALVWSIASAACVAMAAASELKLTREAKSGVDALIAHERAWDRDCKAQPVTITMTQQPKNGTISVVPGTSTIPASTPETGSTGKCAGKTMTGKEIMYRSKAGFSGVDTIAYDVVRDDRNVGSRTVTINVK